MIYNVIVDGCWKRPKFQLSAFQGLGFIIFDQCSPMNHRSEGTNPSSSEGGSLKGGYSVSGNQLVKVVDGKTELQKVGGQVVNIVFQ